METRSPGQCRNLSPNLNNMELTLLEFDCRHHFPLHFEWHNCRKLWFLRGANCFKNLPAIAATPQQSRPDYQGKTHKDLGTYSIHEAYGKTLTLQTDPTVRTFAQ